MKILFIIESLVSGGKERQLIETVKGLRKNNILIGLITFNENQHYTESVKKNVNFFAIHKKRPNKLKPFFTIWRSILEFNPDIIHTWDMLSSLYSLLPSRVFRSKMIDGSIRDAGIEKGWQLFLKKILLKRSELVIANSMAGLNYYNVKGEVIYNAIDMRRFHRKKVSDEVNVIMVANFTDYKDHKTFINAAIELINSNIIDKVYLAGDGHYKQSHIDYIRKKHSKIFTRFHFLGSINNVEHYLAKCRFGVLSSTFAYSEGVSNSVLEYMAAELVPIATNVGGMKEVIDDGVSGFLVEEKNSDRIAEIIRSLQNDPEKYACIIQKAKEVIEAKFSYEQNINKLRNIYDKICTK